MALPKWPTGLRYEPRREPFSVDPRGAPVVVSDVEDGPSLARAQSLTRIKELRYALPFTDGELATFETFAEDTLVQSTAHFKMPVRVAGGSYMNHRCFIKGGAWKHAPYGTGWTAEFTLCVFPASAEALPHEAALAWDGEALGWGGEQMVWM